MAGDEDTPRIFPFRYKLTLLIAMIVIVVLVAIFVVVQRYIEREFRELVLRQIEQTDRYVSEKMNARYENLLSNAVSLADDTLFLDVLTDKSLSELTRNDIVREEIFPALINVESLVVFDADGVLVGHTFESDEMADSAVSGIRTAGWFEDLLIGERSSGYLYQEDLYQQCVGIPVFIGEEMIGIVVASRELSGEQLIEIKQTSDADIAILRDRKAVLSTIWTWSNDKATLSTYLDDFNAWLAQREPPPADSIDAIPPEEVRFLDERFLVREVVDPTGFMPPYAIVQSLDRRLEFLGELQTSTILIGAVGVVAGIALGLMMALAVSRPIEVLRHATHEVERENLGYRVSIQTHDEFSELGESFNEMIAGLAEKQRIRSAFDKSVSPEVADHILTSGAALGGERRRATMLFSDIRGFTTLAEKLDPEALIGLLNAHFTRTNGCIHSYHGVTDKFVGDAVMAIFGVPVVREQHALDAVRAGQDLLGTLDQFNREVASRYNVEVEIGVGVNTGDVIAGLVGSADRLAYTTVGDDVNLASRLEGLTKMYGVKMILGEETIRELQKMAPDAYSRLPIRELDRARVKGKNQPVSIYELMMRSVPPEELAPQLELFAQARRCLANRDFEGASTHLELILSAWPEDGGARSLNDRCKKYAADPRLYDLDFDGDVRVLTSK